MYASLLLMVGSLDHTWWFMLTRWLKVGQATLNSLRAGASHIKKTNHLLRGWGLSDHEFSLQTELNNLSY